MWLQKVTPIELLRKFIQIISVANFSLFLSHILLSLEWYCPVVV
jgi:hypothetical protein